MRRRKNVLIFMDSVVAGTIWDPNWGVWGTCVKKKRGVRQRKCVEMAHKGKKSIKKAAWRHIGAGGAPWQRFMVFSLQENSI